MNYEFPVITHIDQVIDVIKDSKEFIVAEREWGFVVNYLVSGPDTFPTVTTAGGSKKMRDAATRAKAIRRECRGMIFSKDGRLISRPFHKFFNVNERDETRADRIDLGQRHTILEKLDGSMIRAIPMGAGTYRLATKMGITDVSTQAEGFISNRKNYDRFFRDTIEQGYTALFEWCSRKQRIVIDYPVDRLVLLAMRNNLDGSYVPVGMLKELAIDYDLDLVQEYRGATASMEHLLAETHDLQGQEGWIIRFEDGHMLKLKGSEYVTIHKAKDRILRENGVIEMLLDEKVDDVKSFLPEADRHALECYEREFWHGVQDTAARWQMAYIDAKSLFGADRKTFAMEWAPKFDQYLRAAIFKAWDNPDFDFRAAVVDAVRKNLGTQNKVNDARYLWGGAKWGYRDNGDE
jgi:RNA ligase